MLMIDTDPEVAVLRAKILKKLQETPVKHSSLLGFSYWTGFHLEPKDFALFDRMEVLYGEKACNSWMVELVVSSGQYRDAGDGWIEFKRE